MLTPLWNRRKERLAIAHPIRHSPLFFSRRPFSAFVRGRGTFVSWELLWVSGRIRFGFLRQTVLFFFLLFPLSSQPYPTQYHLYFGPRSKLNLGFIPFLSHESNTTFHIRQKEKGTDQPNNRVSLFSDIDQCQ